MLFLQIQTLVRDFIKKKKTLVHDDVYVIDRNIRWDAYKSMLMH